MKATCNNFARTSSASTYAVIPLLALGLSATACGDSASEESRATSQAASDGDESHATSQAPIAGYENGTSRDASDDGNAADGVAAQRDSVAPLADERRFASLRQLTFAGENAEAYPSPDGKQLVFQRRHEGEHECDQIFTVGMQGGEMQLVSSGLGRTTCAYFLPGGSRILYSSTHSASRECPPQPDMSRGYVWALHDYDIYTAQLDGSDTRLLFGSPGYDAEATVAPDGSRIVFTSTRDGDLDIYSMNVDGSDVRKLTNELGYDGGPFYSPDGSKIVFRARHPATTEEVADYQALLAENLVRPSVMDIYIMDADGSNRRRLTDNGAANFAPFFHPGGEQVIFASNLNDTESRNFDLFLINVDGTGLEQITFSADFDGFPVFTPDGRHLVFQSNRNGSHDGNTNIFVAEWVEELP